MMLRWLVAAAHLLALGIGLGAVWARARALQGPLDTAGLRRVFSADAWWGVAALLWLGTGLLRAFGGLEKGSAYYLHNHVFWTKMALFGAILILEAAAMTAFTKWRGLLRRGQPVDTSLAGRYARISYIEAGLVAAMVLAATAMARGYGTTAR
ncbi:MAG: DUF2214 family protein [Gemmatimonadota bacterium]|nr:DUF2214 family protein [Gemmatimonadales bacterium]MDQ3137414.1 DUF2214 family protein [Gemmatimonadota bacterium]